METPATPAMAAAAYHACRGVMAPRATGLDLVRVTSRSTSTSVASLTAQPLPRMRVAPTAKAATTRPSGTWPACVASDAPYRHGQSSSKAPDGRWSRASSTYARPRPSTTAIFSSVSPSARFGRASTHKQRLPLLHARAHAFICARSIATFAASSRRLVARPLLLRRFCGRERVPHVHVHARFILLRRRARIAAPFANASARFVCNVAADDDVQHVRARTFKVAPTFPSAWARRRRLEVSEGRPLARARLRGWDEAREALPIRNRAHAARAFRSTSRPPAPPSSNVAACRSRSLAQALPAAPTVARVLRRSQDRSLRVHGALRRATHAWPCRRPAAASCLSSDASRLCASFAAGNRAGAFLGSTRTARRPPRRSKRASSCETPRRRRRSASKWTSMRVQSTFEATKEVNSALNRRRERTPWGWTGPQGRKRGRTWCRRRSGCSQRGVWRKDVRGRRWAQERIVGDASGYREGDGSDGWTNGMRGNTRKPTWCPVRDATRCESNGSMQAR